MCPRRSVLGVRAAVQSAGESTGESTGEATGCVDDTEPHRGRRAEVGRRTRRAEHVPLGELAPECAQRRELFEGLDTLGDRAQAE